ncbi:ArsR/SmtB family transcription factor [Sediminicoccus rosea]|uniref:Metalloregulator ArsR/SmtB family transcription factor n=1 Tax=Sediminicoccus rosea TaxID=1225128 RepID=A0ABZ0PBV1_9PROT|nr:metalloregulator ArsR/SmtB family transcription factor [Sediminicoccus rosea]WPB83164.1 metalloregulator ArsR/SmtB family transcription factor [Sediminicoccus rosea]
MSSSDASPKQRLLAQFAAVARALGHEHRLDLLELLGQGERTVEGLAARTGQPFANTSQHLQNLRRAGLVETRREGRHVVYRLKDEAVLALMTALRHVAERNIAEVRQIVATYFSARDSLEAVTRQDLVGRLKAGDVVVLDVRPEDEFAAGHLPGAINVPLASLNRAMLALPREKEIVAYCRGPYCVLSFDAVEALRGCGFQARRLEDGFPEWKAAGLTVEAA